MNDLSIYEIDDIAIEGTNRNVYTTWREHEKKWKGFLREGKKAFKSGDKETAKKNFQKASDEAADMKAFLENLPQDKSAAILSYVSRALLFAIDAAVLAYDIFVLKRNSKLANVPKSLTAYNATVTGITGASITAGSAFFAKEISEMKKVNAQTKTERELGPNDYNLAINKCRMACDKLIKVARDLANKCS